MAFDYENKDTGGGTATTINKGDADSVSVKSRDVQEWMDRSLLPRTLIQGTYGMKKAGNSFLPAHTLESTKAYNGRLSRSTLLNAFKKTASFLAGQVFQSDVVFDDGVDPAFEEWAESIDAAENSLDVFAKRVFQNGISKGVAHVFIDVPKKEADVVSQKDEKDAGIRPYFKEIKPEDVLGAIINEDGFLVQLRISESVVLRVGKYGTKIVQRVRVLEPGLWELYEMDDNGASSMIDSGAFSIPIIPLVTFIPGDEWTIITGETPIMDLAELNSKHWRSMSDQDNILSVARVPILFGKNIEIEKMPVGTATMVTSEDNDADMKFIEIQGNAIAAGREDLKETEAQMALYGLQQLVPRTGNMTATEKALTSAESNSSLGTWATEFESVLNACFDIAGQFMGKEWPDNGLAVNKEYNFGVADPEELNAILKSNEQGILSAQATFSEFRRRGVYEEHLSWEDMEADLEQEKRDNIDMARMAGAAFGDAPGDDSNETSEEKAAREKEEANKKDGNK